MTTERLVCLRCERVISHDTSGSQPKECPNCGRHGYWAIQHVAYGVGEVQLPPMEVPEAMVGEE